MNNVFLLSPARCDGRRAQMLLSEKASFTLAQQLRSAEGAPLGDVFSFLSGLYFRGKLAYATAFGAPSGDAARTFVITTNRGLMTPSTRVHVRDLADFSTIDIAAGDPRYLAALRRDAERLVSEHDARQCVVLLGSIATGKYADTLLEIFGERLLFPTDFVGRGDMSRGGLLLRSVRDGRELAYQPVLGAVRHGKRPPKLEQIR